ncbi:transglycosylase SLT domain-containing protein [Neisseriaceae bacterium PsAf]|nr:transglycosylase SLT domain-containing protein [Neisseriaceae bacterium PsAf]MCV2503438.1 lytic transglycosylase domain-containing protein [Neisseriaceae bacterium]
MQKKISLIFFAVVFSNALSNDVDDIVDYYAKQENIDPLLVRSIIYHESRGNVKALSHVGAMGLMQVMPATAKFVGVDPGKLYVADQNIKAGVLYLSFLKRNFNGDLKKMVAAYNAGHGAVQKYGGIPPYRETVNYTKSVLDTYSRYKGGYISPLAISGVGSSKVPVQESKKQFLLVVQNDTENDIVKNSSRKGRAYSSVSSTAYAKTDDKNHKNRKEVLKSKRNGIEVSQNNSSYPRRRGSDFIQIISGD